MGRIRTIKPEFWKHEALSELPEYTHMLAAALLNYADDEGYFNANPRLVQAECLPLREGSVSIHDALTQLSNVGYLRIGTGPNGRQYGHILKFGEHQRVNRPTPSKIKDISIDWGGSHTTHTQLTEPSLPERNREQGTGNREQGKETRPIAASESDFQDFWDAYPHRHGKKKRADAEKAFARALKSGATVEQIARGVEHMRRDPTVRNGYARDPTSWLNQRGWEDEFSEEPTPSHTRSASLEAARLFLGGMKQ